MKSDETQMVKNPVPFQPSRSVSQTVPVEGVHAKSQTERENDALALQELEQEYSHGAHDRRRRRREPDTRTPVDIAQVHGIDLENVPQSVSTAFEGLLAELSRAAEETETLHNRLDFLQEVADHDPVTGLLNRRAVSAAIERVVALDRRNQSESRLILLRVRSKDVASDDLDARDGIASMVARVISGLLPTGEVAGRIFDDTFAVLAVAAGEEEAREMLSRIVEDTSRAGGQAVSDAGRITFQAAILPLPADTGSHEIISSALRQMENVVRE